jgi:SAM-dependent methyltransferase
MAELQATALCADPQFREALWRHCRYVDGARMEALNTRVHPNDQMLSHSLRHHRDPNHAVSQYFNIALQQHNVSQQLFRQAFPDDWHARSVLDFACGYGRNIRLLTLAIPAAQVWGSEIQQEAVAFVAQEFGVHGLQSEFDPARFQPGRRFDFIWVASLFSHLPPALFQSWLERLAQLLTPDGVLCFSVHDEWELTEGRVMPPSGILFYPESENAGLSTAAYGTTYVAETYVHEAIGRAFGTGCSSLRIPRALAAHQDLYVAARGGNRLSSLKVEKGAWGWVDIITLAASGDLYIAGWGASLDRGAIPGVEIRLDGVVHHCPTAIAREDLIPVVGDDRGGFKFYATVDSNREIFVEVSAEAAPNEVALLYAGKVSATT